MRRLVDYTRPSERLEIRRFFEANPKYRELFGRDWLARMLSPFLTRDEAPPILWTLLTEPARERLIESLELLSAQRDIAPVVRDLKQDDPENVGALLCELEVFRLMRKNNASVRWKPSVEGTGGRSPDLGATYNGQDLFVEVFALLEPSEDVKEYRRLVPIDRAIDQMMDHSYEVMSHVLGEVRDNDVPRAIAFVKRTIARLRAAGVKRAEETFRLGGKALLQFTFKRLAGGRKGYHGVKSWRLFAAFDAGRIKKKLLDKLDRFQFPKGAQLKGYVIVLKALTADEEDVADALLGKSAVQMTLDPDKGESRITSVTREANGVIADAIRGKRLLDEVDFVVAMTWGKAGALKVAAAFVNEDRKRLTRDEVLEFFE